MESSQNNNNTNKIRIILPPPMILQNNNNNTSLPPPRLDNSLSLPILSSMSSNSNNSNSVFSGLLPKRSSSLAQNSINNINSSSSSSSNGNGNSNNNSNSNNNKIELPPIESLDHGNLKNSTFSQNRHSFAATTVNNNPTDFLSSNRMSVSAILSNNNNNNNDDDDVNNCDQPQHHSITTPTPSMISIPSLSSLTQLLDGRTANPKLYDDTNNLRNLHRYNDNGNDNNKNNRCSNNDARGIVGDDEIMEDVITNDNCKNDDNTDDDDVVDDVDDSDSDDVGDAISDEDEIISSNNARKLKRRYKKILQKEKERRHHLGQLVYSPKEILPPLEFNINSLLDIWIPAKHLSWENLKVRKRFLWGTDIYTDDSDIVAVLIHTGNYIPTNYPDHDLRVTIRVYRKLPQYPASTRNNYKSRHWGSHDGVSYKIEKVEKMKHSEMIGRLKRKKNKILKKIHNHNNVMMVIKNKKLIKEASRKSEKKSNDLTVFNKRGDQCCRYSPNLVSDTNYFRNRLLVEVMYLENDDETYEISYDEVRDKYRFAIVSSHAEESENNDSKDSDGNKATEKAQQDVADGYYNDGDGELKDCPLGPKDLYEIFRDDLEFHEMSWNILGLVVADKTNDLHNLFCIVQRVFWRPKTRRDG